MCICTSYQDIFFVVFFFFVVKALQNMIFLIDCEYRKKVHSKLLDIFLQKLGRYLGHDMLTCILLRNTSSNIFLRQKSVISFTFEIGQFKFI